METLHTQVSKKGKQVDGGKQIEEFNSIVIQKDVKRRGQQ